jgi:putative PIN family toxin of toxin-antitoxin system
MQSNSRFVFDTNVVVSALLLTGSVPRQAFDKALNRGKILLSLPVLAEVNEVFSRKRFDKYLLEEERVRFLAALVREAEMVEITIVLTACRDPKDNKFLELAVSGNATCIVSGDEDLLALNPFQGIPVLAPKEFLSYI